MESHSPAKEQKGGEEVEVNVGVELLSLGVVVNQHVFSVAFHFLDHIVLLVHISGMLLFEVVFLPLK